MTTLPPDAASDLPADKNVPAARPAPAPTLVHEALHALRARAETRRQLVTQATERQTPADLQRLVQELQVHQIELEMQYEELLLAQAEAQAARAQYVDLYDFAPVGYFSLSDAGVIEQLNLCGAQLLGAVRQRLQGRRFGQFVEPTDREAFGQFLARVFRTERAQQLELRLRRDDNRLVYVQLEGLQVATGPDAPQCRLVVLDVSQRREATLAREAAEARFRATFEQSNDGMILLEGHSFVDFNAAALRLLGTTDPRQVRGKSMLPFWPERQPDGRLTIDTLNTCLDLAQTSGWCRIELRRTLPNGREVWDELSFNPVLVQGRPLLHAIWRDVTTPRTAREQLRLSEERLQMALGASETGIFTWDVASSLVQCDARTQAIFGRAYDPRPIAMDELNQALHPADADRVAAAYQVAIEYGTALALDYRVLWADGSVHHVSLAGRLVRDGRRQTFAGVFRDVTALYEAEEELRVSQDRLQLALTASASGVWSWEISSNQLYFDGRARAIFGYEATPAVLTFAEVMSAVHPDDLALVEARIQQVFHDGTPLDSEHRIRQLDGSVRTITVMGTVVRSDEGHPLRLTGIVRDITHRRETQAQLRREKEFSDSLLQHSIDGIAAFDREGRITAWNVEAARYARLSAEAVLGRSIFEVYPRFNNPETLASVQRVLAGEQVALLGLRFSHRDGEYDTYLVPLSSQSGEVTGILAIIRDVTERNRLAEEATRLRLRQQQEVLSAILETQETERKRIAEALHNGLGQVLYATKLSLEGKGSARPPAESLKLLNEAIRTTRTISFELTPGILQDFGLRIALEELVKRISPRHLPINLHLQGLEPALPAPVEIAVYRIVQELLNNVLKHAQATEVEVHVVRENKLLEVSVEDNGQGFDANMLASAPLEGIGLAGIRNRVALLGGTLQVQSQPGRGTIVSIEVEVEQAQ
ncbi:hypothetical protein GCM10023185_36060 [Hymenobacter saemangeumensis]|uniref:histidine kinase n=1 Tax=Hymenobacter saemangeumensis TaxID=1084522 RepID=A0ABP8IQI0_9BACT